MDSGYRELEGITADLGIEAWGRDLTEAMAQAILGLASLLTDISLVRPVRTRTVRVASPDTPSLLVNVLNEIIFLEETEDFLVGRVVSLSISEDALTASLAGETYDTGRHVRGAGIKAATYHGLTIKEKDDIVNIRVIFDI